MCMDVPSLASDERECFAWGLQPAHSPTTAARLHPPSQSAANLVSQRPPRVVNSSSGHGTKKARCPLCDTGLCQLAEANGRCHVRRGRKPVIRRLDCQAISGKPAKEGRPPNPAGSGAKRLASWALRIESPCLRSDVSRSSVMIVTYSVRKTEANPCCATFSQRRRIIVVLTEDARRPENVRRKISVNLRDRASDQPAISLRRSATFQDGIVHQ